MLWNVKPVQDRKILQFSVSFVAFKHLVCIEIIAITGRTLSKFCFKFSFRSISTYIVVSIRQRYQFYAVDTSCTRSFTSQRKTSDFSVFVFSKQSCQHIPNKANVHSLRGSTLRLGSTTLQSSWLPTGNHKLSNNATTNFRVNTNENFLGFSEI